jgi:integrase/recombinase XerC
MSDTPPDRGTLDAARMLLERLGVTPEDLLAEPAAESKAPTFAEFMPTVTATLSPGSQRVYGTYLNRAVDAWGDRPLDTIVPSDIAMLAQRIRVERIVRRTDRGGSGAVEHLVGALRYFYKCAVNDKHLTDSRNPAKQVPKPRRKPSTRRGLPDEQVAELVAAAAAGGDDPALDALMMRFHIETACRRGGLLSLQPRDLDPTLCLVLLREKAETQRWQPVSPTLMVHLLAHVESRGGTNGNGTFRHPNGKPITKRRYEQIWERLGKQLSWVSTQMVTAHWLRHTTLTWVERNFGHAVAQAYAGHSGPGDGNSTANYVKATLQEVAKALAELSEEAHPLAT